MAGTNIHIVKFDPIDPRLGWHVEHDERSLNFMLAPRDLKPKRINSFWSSKAGPLNQGDIGSCTGNARVQWGNTDWAIVLGSMIGDENEAVKEYALGTHLDNIAGYYPDEDTGCTGNAVCKAAKKIGKITGYKWLFSYQSGQATVERMPVMNGTLWTKNMMDDPVNGLMTVGSLADSNIAGGHEYLWCGIDWKDELDIFRQSWGDGLPGYKPGGYFAISHKEHRALIEAQGDITIPIL